MCPSSWKLFVDDFPLFWFLSSSSRTRARAVWSLGDKRATNHHHRRWHQLQTAQTLNSSSSSSIRAWEEPKKRKIIRFGHTEALNMTLNGHFSCPAQTDPYAVFCKCRYLHIPHAVCVFSVRHRRIYVHMHINRNTNICPMDIHGGFHLSIKHKVLSR